MMERGGWERERERRRGIRVVEGGKDKMGEKMRGVSDRKSGKDKKREGESINQRGGKNHNLSVK